jgi:hypothetical protein
MLAGIVANETEVNRRRGAVARDRFLGSLAVL